MPTNSAPAVPPAGIKDAAKALLRRRTFQIAALCLAAFATSAAVALNVFEAMPHLEDEHANYFQAQVFARGVVAAPAPPSRDSFNIPFVIVRDGLWFGKYTPGFPLILALGVLAGAPWIVNALASALALLGVYLLGRDLFGADAGLLAAALGAVSPAFVILSGSLLPHPVTMCALVFFAWGFLRARADSRHPGVFSAGAPRPDPRHPGVFLARAPRSLPPRSIPARIGFFELGWLRSGGVLGRGRAPAFAVLSGAALGLAVLCRPWTALAVALPFIAVALADVFRAVLGRDTVHGRIGHTVKNGRSTLRPYGCDWRNALRPCVRAYLPLVMVCLGICALLLLYNYFVTGSPFTNTYTLWWPYDTVGFGPGVGTKGGHTLLLGVFNVRKDLIAFQTAFTGWPVSFGIPLAALVLILGLILAPRSRTDLLLLLPPLALIAAHLAYWARAGDFFGGRYFSEGMPFLWLLAARGFLKFSTGYWKLLAVRAALPIILAWGIFFQILPRFVRGHGLYGTSRENIAASGTAGLHNALVFITISSWEDYANFSWLNSPFLDNDVIFVRDIGEDRNIQIIEALPGREVYYYTPGGALIPADD